MYFLTKFNFFQNRDSTNKNRSQTEPVVRIWASSVRRCQCSPRCQQSQPLSSVSCLMCSYAAGCHFIRIQKITSQIEWPIFSEDEHVVFKSQIRMQ